MHQAPQAPIAVVATALITACARAIALPPPCASKDSLYRIGSADTSLRILRPYPMQIYPPPLEFRGAATVQLFVDARGRVLADSTRVENATPENARLLKQSVAGYRFYPATQGSCAVSSWYGLRISGL